MTKTGKRKFTEKDIVDIRELYSGGDFTIAELGKMYEVSTVTIWRIINGVHYKEVSNGETVIPAKHRRKRKPRCTLKDDDIIAIREAWARSLTQKELATQYGVNVSTIRAILDHRTWKHLPSVEDIRKQLGRC